MGQVKAALYFGGAAIEVVGIVLLASPDLFPVGVRFARFVVRQYRRLRAWVERSRIRWWVEGVIRRLLRRPRHVTVTGSPAGALVGGVAPRVVIGGVGGTATLQEKVEYLLARDRDVKGQLERMKDRLDSAEKGIVLGLDDLRASMTAHVASSLGEAHRRYIEARYLGIVLVILGLAVATLGNFVE
jgi:hypothetical protein